MQIFQRHGFQTPLIEPQDQRRKIADIDCTEKKTTAEQWKMFELENLQCVCFFQETCFLMWTVDIHMCLYIVCTCILYLQVPSFHATALKKVNIFMWTTLFISCTVFTVLSGHLESSEQKMQPSSSKFSRRRPKNVNVLHACCWFGYWRPDPKRHEMARFDTSIILRPVPHTPGTSIILRPVPPMWFRVTRMDTNWHELARIGTH